MKYVAFDYEDGAEPPFWHIYCVDNEPEWVEFSECSIMQIEGPDTPEMFRAMKAIVDAIDAAIDVAVAQRRC